MKIEKKKEKMRQLLQQQQTRQVREQMNTKQPQEKKKKIGKRAHTHKKRVRRNSLVVVYT